MRVGGRLEVAVDADAVLKEIEELAETRFLPIIGPVKGEYLVDTVTRFRVCRVLEVGTLIGYSAILIAKNLPDGGKVSTIEVNPGSLATAEANIRKAGLAEKVTLYAGNAIEVIPKIPGRFDMALLDATKREYLDYLRLAEPKLKKGGVVFADNVKVFASEMTDYLEYVRNSNRYRSRFIDVGYDGVEISVKIA
ncbi:MAG: class I SAM-dependent methyltransferase [Dehalococcoidales bacterium]|nr:class I SAM-dependent methyltransferase [Dehalococcoidales bacterium]